MHLTYDSMHDVFIIFCIINNYTLVVQHVVCTMPEFDNNYYNYKLQNELNSIIIIYVNLYLNKKKS